MKLDIPEFIIRHLNKYPSDQAYDIIQAHNLKSSKELKRIEIELENTKSKRLYDECQYDSLRHLFDEKKRQYEADSNAYKGDFDNFDSCSDSVKVTRSNILRESIEYQTKMSQIRNGISTTFNMDENFLNEEISQMRSEKTILLVNAEQCEEFLSVRDKNKFVGNFNEYEDVVVNLRNFGKEEMVVNDLKNSISTLEAKVKSMDDEINKLNKLLSMN